MRVQPLKKRTRYERTRRVPGYPRSARSRPATPAFQKVQTYLYLVTGYSGTPPPLRGAYPYLRTPGKRKATTTNNKGEQQ